MYTFVYRTFIKFMFFCRGQALFSDFFFILSLRQLPILMSLLYHNDTIIKKEKELLRALLGQFYKLEVVIVNHFLIFQSMDSALNLLSQHLME